MEPQPALAVGDWLIDIELFRRSIGVEAEGANETRQRLSQCFPNGVE
jgi:hypothetical protein